LNHRDSVDESREDGRTNFDVLRAGDDLSRRRDGDTGRMTETGLGLRNKVVLAKNTGGRNRSGDLLETGLRMNGSNAGQEEDQSEEERHSHSGL
jgi:hypothetical protein